MENKPIYDDFTESDEFFHWKSFAIREACMEVFRKDADAVAQGLKESFKASDSSEDEMPARVTAANREGCSRARACKAAIKMRAELRAKSPQVRQSDGKGD